MTFVYKKPPEEDAVPFNDLPVGAVTEAEFAANTVRLTGTPRVLHTGSMDRVVVVNLECREV